jgi:hypothetical protein
VNVDRWGTWVPGGKAKGKEPEMLYVGVDAHKSASQLTVVDELGKVLAPKRSLGSLIRSDGTMCAQLARSSSGARTRMDG